MKTTRQMLALLLLLPLAAGCIGDDPAGTTAPTDPPPHASAIEAGGPTLSLVALDVGEGSGDLVTLELRYNRREGQEGPRAAEIWLKHSAGLAFESAEALAAATDAGKTVHAQARPDGELRLVVYGTATLDRLGSGPLARLHFRRGDAAGPHTVEILARMPIFAPAEVNQGVHLAPQLVVEGG